MISLSIFATFVLGMFYMSIFRPFTPKCPACGGRRWEPWSFTSSKMVCSQCRGPMSEKRRWRRGRYGEDGPMDA